MLAEVDYFGTVWVNIPIFSGDRDLCGAHERMEDLVSYGKWLND
jgi:hypothetical protein